MITLLLGLFIVLFAMSSIDAKQFDNVKRSLSQTFNGEVLTEAGGITDGSDGVMDPNAPAEATQSIIAVREQAGSKSAARFEQEAKELKATARQALGNDVKVTSNERGITVSLAGDALFDPGSSALKPGVQESLTTLEQRLEKFGHPIEIVGHTDGVPHNGQYGNWTLSAERSRAVLFHFFSRGFPKHLARASYRADTEPAVAPPKNNPQADMPQNRRIEITILAPGANSGAAPAKIAGRAQPADPQVDPVGAAVQSAVVSGIVDDVAETSKAIEH